MHARYALSVSYTNTSLVTSQASMAHAYYLEESPALEDLQLGYDARHEESYWEAVREMIRSPIVNSPARRNVSIVLVYGDATEKTKFKEILEEVVLDVIHGEPEILNKTRNSLRRKGQQSWQREPFSGRQGIWRQCLSYPSYRLACFHLLGFQGENVFNFSRQYNGFRP